jgi:hypothetical protein
MFFEDDGSCGSLHLPIYALESVLTMYEEYHNLGGNGTITQLVDELKELPKE